ncbi:PREDICTED: uncharacterized protein LOC106747127 isoform X2 [Dinoponera quadriceps]|uniref:Uncharacterized protein LOC106747127 isoform X2 n=1 Tax=Dinoponera quadriceps TaxID=609295 RepID=A0A6P3XN73_DINQU|nr:PREDICTED: uncharacterized protein LOC106747127 isoform X2 [Dinoponera quadriceps]
MDEYDKKFAEMQKYIPFLEAMIERLQNVKDKSREIQLQKMQSLHGILSNSKRKLRIETLQRCEDVLQKLHNRVEKFQGNAPGLQLPTKRNDGNTSQPSTSSEDAKSDPSNRTEKSPAEDAVKDKFEETPASPDPSVSPDAGCQILPIIIPTERSTDFSEHKSDQEHGNSKIPVITITERPGTINISSSDSNHSDDVVFTEWDMLEESQKHNSKARATGDWQSLAGHDVASAAKLISSNLPQKLGNTDSRGYSMSSRSNIPTVPVPSLGGSRRLSSVLEKTKVLSNLDIAAVTIRAESPVNVPEVRLKSPDPEILFPRSKVLSPRSAKDHGGPRTPTKTPMPLLVSPPPIFTTPPLSMEDLEELLSGGDEKRGERKAEDAARHSKKDPSGKQETNLTKDGTKMVSQTAAERESEKQWEEVDKHIIKLGGRKITSNVINAASAMIAKIESKSSEMKTVPQAAEHRSPQAPSTSSKFEPRYADNYEKHPRQRDAHGHEKVKEKPAENPCRLSESQEASPISTLHVSGKNVDDRIGLPLYQRRPSAPSEGWKDVVPPSRPDHEFVIEGTDYYNMHMNQQLHWQPMPSMPGNDPFGNAQWTGSSYSGMPVGGAPQPYPPHPGMGMFMAGSPVDSPHAGAGPRPPYRPFPMGQSSYDPGFDRPAEYSHARPTWEPPAGRGDPSSYGNDNAIPCGIGIVEQTATGSPYQRSDTPCPWSRERNRGGRGRSRDGYYNERNRAEVRPSFNNRDVRRLSDRPRDENPGRFRNAFERDPRVRMEHNNAAPSPVKEASSPGSARDPRLAKDKHFSPTKVKESVHNERDPRKRPVPPPVTAKKTTNSNKEKPKSQKRGDLESSGKEKTADKLKADNRMQSPLESLYGVIDTKSSHSSGLQKFKIPKIKRPEPPQPPPPPLPSSTTSQATDEAKEAGAVFKPPRAKSDGKKAGSSPAESADKDDAIAEVSSTSNGGNATDSPDASSKQEELAREDEIISSLVEETSKKRGRLSGADSARIVKSMEIAEKDRKDETEADSAKTAKEEVTQEWIEALIRKSFECGEGKKLVEHAKLIQKLGEALQAKKLKKIQKIIESESESSSSDKDEDIGLKRSQTRKKRRVIVSDSSDDECLAERLGILSSSVAANDGGVESVSPETLEDFAESVGRSAESRVERKSDGPSEELGSEIGELAAYNTRPEESNEQDATERCDGDNRKDDQLEDGLGKGSDRSGGNNGGVDARSENDGQSPDGRLEDGKGEEQLVGVEHAKKDAQEGSLDKDETDRTNDKVNDKPKAKTKRRNSLEMLQEDIREMFISEGVVTATGFRMCRLPKENQPSPASSTSAGSKKDEASSAREPSIEADESTASTAKSKKTSSKSRGTGESNKSTKVKGKKDAQRPARRQRAKEPDLAPSSDSEEDQPLALRAEWKPNSSNGSNSNDTTPRHEEDDDDSLPRRSKRMLQQKEPRVLVEKTDLTKLEAASKAFDSSSDESFSIDVSELAAAVDISLQPDKQSDQESVETVVSSKLRSRAAKNAGRPNLRARRRSASLLTDCKSDDAMSFTDEESVISDISMSSSTTGRKRGASKVTKEELLSNILVGLVEKSNKDDEEADVDDDSNCPSPPSADTSAKKSVKKKKKNSWKMGILTKKKRKKIPSVPAKASGQLERQEETSNETNVSMDNAEGDLSSVSDNNKIATANDIPEETVDKQSADDASMDSTLKCDDVVKQPASTDSPVAADHQAESSNLTVLSESSNATEETLSNEVNKLTLDGEPRAGPREDEAGGTKSDAGGAEETGEEVRKSVEDIAEKSTVATEEEAPKVATTTVVYNEVMKELYRRINKEQLIEYAWSPDQNRYECQLCLFVGKNIVHHYKVNHSDAEVMIARFKPADAKLAIEDGLEDDAASASTTKKTKRIKYRCRFCHFETEGAADMALEAFYEHCTTHTGEYRHHCKCCPYQAVAKSSLRTHYYKMCRKLHDTFYDCTIEDRIPQENGVYGYLCRECNYVQLKRENVKAHLAFWHEDKADVEILKINMSAASARKTDAQKSQECAEEKPTAEEIKEESNAPVSEVEEGEVREDAPAETTTSQATDVSDAIAEPRETSDNNNEESHSELHESKAEEKVDEVRQEETDTGTSAQGDAPINTTECNMSVFVCPPELENKEVEIQLERKKRMQEIVENIGIKINKNPSKSSLSIIDKLQDKMRTECALGSSGVTNDESNVASEQRGNSEAQLPLAGDSANEESKLEEEGMTNVMEDRLASQPTTGDIEAEDPRVSTDNDKSNMAGGINADKAEPKIRDPLAVMDPGKNSTESDGEISDCEAVRRSPVFESDSSSEQSDSEPADVNMILKETSSINASSSARDPMLTTIQRLAAQLQGVKPMEVPAAEEDVKLELPTPITPIPRAPNVISIGSIKHSLLRKKDPRHRETTLPISATGDRPPKNFLRLRRLSGDMLSLPAPPLSDSQEDASALSADDGSLDLPQSESTADILQTDTEEECSFLKIENVVSLAPNSGNSEVENPIINDIRKAVEVSPVKNKATLLLKKAHQPLILKKNNMKPSNANVPTVTQPSTSDTMTFIPVNTINQMPISTKAVTTHLATNFMPIHPRPAFRPTPNVISLENAKIAIPRLTPITRAPTAATNCKVLKVVRNTSGMKLKDVTIATLVAKLKSTDAYWDMLKPSKLIHFYKCMSRDCHFTTDSMGLFCQHYNKHREDAEKQNVPSPYDFQKCVYCFVYMATCNEVKNHMWEKHSHCRYQCSYCFYRASTVCYVQQHQMISHPNTKFFMLVGKKGKDMSQQEDTTNRVDNVLPFICEDDCRKKFYVPETFILHLGTKYSSSTLLPTYNCHLCKSTYHTIKAFMNHYKTTHGLAKYQCLYCLHGADTPHEMLQHLSVWHWGQPPQTLERSLPPHLASKDVLNQLIVRTYNDDGNLKPHANEVNVGAAGSKEDASDRPAAPATDTVNVQISSGTVTLLTYTDSNNVETVLCQEGAGLINIAKPDFLGTVDGRRPGTAEVATTKQPRDATFLGAANEDAGKSADASPKQQSPSRQLTPGGQPSGKPNENRSLLIRSQEKPSDYATTKSFNESPLELLSCTDDSNTIADSLEFSGDFSCADDEFVNTNLLDNPDFMKSLTANSFSKGNVATSAGDKTEDSDIEILENPGNNAEAPAEKKVAENHEEQTTEPESSSKEKKMESEEQPETCDTTDDKFTSSEAATNPENAATATIAQRPLTLEDIKDTGFRGLDLYKCGYEGCNFAATVPPLLKKHVKECTFGANDKNFYCAHCKKRFIKVGFLLEHLKVHGVKRFGCSLCKMRYPVSYQATAHMKTKHKFQNTKLVPADPTNPSVDGLFIVQAIRCGSGERKTKKRRGLKLTEPDAAGEKAASTLDSEKLSFSPDEIDRLPRQAIYIREVHCAVCPYTTKVRTNIIRHLQLHAKDETVPETGPVNPVPCLDKKERMFDKMVNLASSSHQNGRMGAKPKEAVKESDEDAIPKFVPEHKRYVCSVAECNYLTVNEAMLRNHLKALHSDEPYFRCPHCPPPSPGQDSQNIAIDKMGVHLKMHDARLYKCSHCNHHHYQRYVVERHLADKHPEKRPFVKVIRELDSTENVQHHQQQQQQQQQQPIQEDAEEEVPDPDGNHWKCNLCDFKCAYKAEMSNHAAAVHDEKCQYKCAVCSFKTSGKVLFEQHISSKHAYDPNVDFVLVYQRIKGVNKRTEIVEQVGQDEPFDTTPLWRRDMPRVRHIRGILLEEEDETPPPAETSSTKGVSLGKRKSDTELSTKLGKAKVAKSASLEENNKQSKEKSKRSLSCEKLSAEGDGQGGRENKSDSRGATDKAAGEDARGNELSDVNDSDTGRFGPYGKPEGNMYICTLCNQFKTKYKHDMRDHLYRELNYARWHCKACGYLSVNRNALMQHFSKHHNGERPDHEPLSPDNAIEDWVITLLKKQTDMIKAASQKFIVIGKSPTAAVTAHMAAPVKGPEAIKPAKMTHADTKAVDLAPAITTLRNDIFQGTDRIVDEIDDGDSRDDEDLVIDMKEDELLDSSRSNDVSESDKSFEKEELEKKLVCKHCDMKFSRRRGFKLHVQLTHLKRLGFLCPYCDRSTNSEQMIRQHMRSKHRDREMKIVHNPTAGGPDLTDEFWEKEYGLICPAKIKKKRKPMSVNDTTKNDGGNNVPSPRPEPQEKCGLCGFAALNYTGLKSHMRSHLTRIRCQYCTYSCSAKAELVDHWQVNHPSLPFKIRGTGEPGSDGGGSKKRSIDIYTDDIEEEQVGSADEENPSITTVYSCGYCNTRSHSLNFLVQHWDLMHREEGSSNNAEPNASSVGGGRPFKYSHQQIPTMLYKRKMIQMAQKKRQSKAKKTKNAESPRGFAGQPGERSPSRSDDSSSTAAGQGWVCQWCHELCETDNDMKNHQDMFHSHLPLNFKKQQQQQQQHHHHHHQLQQQQEEESRDFVCRVCSYPSPFLASIKKHVVKHVNLFKCKYCDQSFKTPAGVSAHISEKHPGLVTKIESIANFDAVVQSMIMEVKRTKMTGDEVGQDRGVAEASRPTSHAVAKKSTAKSVLSYVKPSPRTFKAVARKSTNPLPRYLREVERRSPAMRPDEEEEKQEEEEQEEMPLPSHYRVPCEPVNLAKVSTYMMLGGHSMKVNCTTLAQLININPRLVLADIRHDPKYSANFLRHV